MAARPPRFPGSVSFFYLAFLFFFFFLFFFGVAVSDKKKLSTETTPNSAPN